MFFIASRCVPHIAKKAEGTWEHIIKKLRFHRDISVPYSPLNSGGIACLVAELYVAHSLVIRARKLRY